MAYREIKLSLNGAQTYEGAFDSWQTGQILSSEVLATFDCMPMLILKHEYPMKAAGELTHHVYRTYQSTYSDDVILFEEVIREGGYAEIDIFPITRLRQGLVKTLQIKPEPDWAWILNNTYNPDPGPAAVFMGLLEKLEK